MSKFTKIMTREKNPKYGLINEYGEIVLPVIYEDINIKEKAGFIVADLRSEEHRRIEVVYEIKEDALIEYVQERETSEFVYMSLGSKLIIMKIDGRIRVIENLNKDVYS